ncbi:conserved exported hypothetical protein [uncultured Paludibacter sp.]|nr:conserved exported hypothetical protein [uncultured Paludibacter sp.]
MKLKRIYVLFSMLYAFVYVVQAQPQMETGGQKMPDEWIDKDTGHKVIKLTRREGTNMSFYFHNNPFVENKMIFVGGSKYSGKDIKGREIYNFDGRNLQMYWVDLNTLKVEQLTHENFPVRTEIVCPKTHEIFYQKQDSVFALNVDTKIRRLIYVNKSKEERFSISTINADGTLLAGVFSSLKEAEILKKNPQKSQFFDRIYEAHLPRTLFTINTQTGELTRIYSEKAWLNHIQFSPTDPHLLMFCHEGPWHKVDRIWTIDVVKKDVPQLRHKRIMNMEIAGHEWFGNKGDAIYCDLQLPRGKTFFVAKINLATNNEQKFELQRDEWSVHYTTSWGENLMAGDGGDSTSVAKARNGKWIYLFKPEENSMRATRLVNMKNHNYNLEPNVHFSPDNKWIIFRANFEGDENVYAVEI